MSNKLDIHYGRQGGRLVAWAGEPGSGPAAPLVRSCSICAEPMLGAQTRHHFTCCAQVGGRTPVCNAETRETDDGRKVKTCAVYQCGREQ